MRYRLLLLPLIVACGTRELVEPPNARDGGSTARDAGAGPRDGGPALRDGGETTRDGGRAVRDGGAVPRDGGPAPTACAAGETRCTDLGGFEACGYTNNAATERTWGARVPCATQNSCTIDGCDTTMCLRPSIMVLVDRTTSMIGQSWIDVRQAVDDFVSAQERSMAIGLRMFPGSAACVPGSILTPAYDNANAVVMNLTDPGGDAQSPIAAAFTGLGAAFGPPVQGQVVVLITDGGEDCGGDAVRAAEILRHRGVRIYTVGIGNQVHAGLLDGIAQAGGTRMRRVVVDRGQIAAVFDEVLQSVNACGPPAGSSRLGEACTAGMECADGLCLQMPPEFGVTFPDGYCSADCSTMACPMGSSCVPAPFNAIEVCLQNCAGTGDCRTGYDCYTVNGSDVCFPNP